MSAIREALERIAAEGECVQEPGGDCHVFCPACLARHVLAKNPDECWLASQDAKGDPDAGVPPSAAPPADRCAKCGNKRESVAHWIGAENMEIRMAAHPFESSRGLRAPVEEGDDRLRKALERILWAHDADFADHDAAIRNGHDVLNSLVKCQLMTDHTPVPSAVGRERELVQLARRAAASWKAGATFGGFEGQAQEDMRGEGALLDALADALEARIGAPVVETPREPDATQQDAEALREFELEGDALRRVLRVMRESTVTIDMKPIRLVRLACAAARQLAREPEFAAHVRTLSVREPAQSPSAKKEEVR